MAPKSDSKALETSVHIVRCRLAHSIMEWGRVSLWRGATPAGGEEQALQLVDGAYGQTEPKQIGLTEEGHLFHITLDMPFGVRTVPEKDHVTDSIALRRHAVALEYDRSFEDHDCLVGIV